MLGFFKIFFQERSSVCGEGRWSPPFPITLIGGHGVPAHDDDGHDDDDDDDDDGHDDHEMGGDDDNDYDDHCVPVHDDDGHEWWRYIK